MVTKKNKSIKKKLSLKNKMSLKKLKKGGGIPPNQQASGPDVAIVPPSYNGGLYTGVPFSGPWGNIPVYPTTTNMINNNLKSANPPPGADVAYPGTERLGNNYQAMPGVGDYQSTSKVNWGPHKINCTKGMATVGGALKKKSLNKKKRRKTYKKTGGNRKK